jgi:hypothetical protein
MVRVLIGLIKGSIVGGGVGYGLLRLGASGGLLAYVGCVAVGALVGLVCGRAPWRSDTIWTPIVKMVVGGLIGLGLAFVGTRFLPDATLHLQGVDVGTRSAPFLALAVGVLYGIFVEVDDGGGKPESAPRQLARPGGDRRSK